MSGHRIKQHITPKQFAEIQKDKIISNYGSEIVDRKDFFNYHHSKFTIGKMIEMIDYNEGGFEYYYVGEESKEICILKLNNSEKRYKAKNLCDCLWEAVKDKIKGEDI